MNRAAWTRLIIIFAMLFPGFGALGYFTLTQDQWLRVVYGFSKILQFSLPAFWVYGILKENFSLTRLTQIEVIDGLKTGAPLFILTLVGYFGIIVPFELLSGSGDLITQKIREFGVSTPLSFFIMAVYISALHSFLEEYYWRWFVFRKLREFMSLKASIWLSSAAFTLHHIVVISYYAPPANSVVLIGLAIAAVFIAGAIWAFQYERNRNIWSLWISHLLVDAALMVVGYHLVFTR